MASHQFDKGVQRRVVIAAAGVKLEIVAGDFEPFAKPLTRGLMVEIGSDDGTENRADAVTLTRNASMPESAREKGHLIADTCIGIPNRPALEHRSSARGKGQAAGDVQQF